MATAEGATLLPSNVPSPDEQRRSRRPQALRIFLGVVSALAMVAGSVVAVDLLAQHQHATVETTSLSSGAMPTSMEAQSGWSAWCSVRAVAGCIFSSDRDNCKEEVKAKCDPSEETQDNDDDKNGDGDGAKSGSGSGVGSGMGTSAGAGSHHGMPNVGEPERRNNSTQAPKKRRGGRHHHKPKHGPQSPIF